jgi:hypothetical protein
MLRAGALVLAASGPLAACGAAARGPARRPPPAAPSCAAFATHGLAVTLPDRAAFRGAVGEPTSVARTPVPNIHVEGQVDTLHVLSRDGLEATYYALPDRDLLSSVTVRDARWLRYSFPTVGTPGAALESAFGPPTEPPAAGAGLGYACRTSPGPDEPVFFRLVADTVREIHFTYYVD